nr:hypothetical protein [Allomuricauda sp.]
MAILLLFLVMACSDDEDDTSSIVLGTLRVENPNFCNHSSGVGGRYDIIIPYSGTQDDILKNVLFEGTLDDGTTSSGVRDQFEGFQLDDGNGELNWGNVCLGFADSAWLDLEVRIETTDGAISSSASIRLNRTDFDN